MRVTVARAGAIICIGKQGENRAMQVLFPVMELLPEEEAKTYTLLIRPEGGEPYTPQIVELSATENYLVWIPTFDDLRLPGIRTAEIKAEGAAGKQISPMYKLFVEESIEYARHG